MFVGSKGTAEQTKGGEGGGRWEKLVVLEDVLKTTRERQTRKARERESE